LINQWNYWKERSSKWVLKGAYLNRGNVYDLINEYQKAIADYTEAIRLDPQNANAYNNRGLSYKNLEEYDQAIADVNEAIRLNPEDAFSYQIRGVSYGALEEYEKASVDLYKAADLYQQQGDRYRRLSKDTFYNWIWEFIEY
jgi:tetratricopeptide (TPR) repeat protein